MARRSGSTSDEALSLEVAASRDAGLSFIANTLSNVLEDTEPAPEGLNSRHPDFATTAVRIGRAMGQEEQIVSALRAAEMDKSIICVENDAITVALVELVKQQEESVGIGAAISGTASEFVGFLQQYDLKAFEKLTARRFSNKVGNLWSHLEKVLKATKETTHGGFLNYTFAQRS
jgi:hypothetical protein